MTSSPAIFIEGLTVREGERLEFSGVSLSMPRGSIYALLGSGGTPAVLLDCLRGKRKPQAGRLTILGLDAGASWRLRRRRVFVPGGKGLRAALAGRPTPELLLLEDPEPAEAVLLRTLATAGTTIFLTTKSPEMAEVIADCVGILARGRLVASGRAEELTARFRRIRYGNRLTETRSAFGTELDEFDAVRVRVRGWGVEAVVSNFSDAAMDRFRAIDGVDDVDVESMTLAEILEAYSETSG